MLLISYIQKMKKLKEVILHSYLKVSVHGFFFCLPEYAVLLLAPLPLTKYPLEGVSNELLTPFFIR